MLGRCRSESVEPLQKQIVEAWQRYHTHACMCLCAWFLVRYNIYSLLFHVDPWLEARGCGVAVSYFVSSPGETQNGITGAARAARPPGARGGGGIDKSTKIMPQISNKSASEVVA